MLDLFAWLEDQSEHSLSSLGFIGGVLTLIDLRGRQWARGFRLEIDNNKRDL